MWKDMESIYSLLHCKHNNNMANKIPFKTQQAILMLENKKIQQKANKKPLELQAQGTDLKQLQGQVTCSFRETLEREKTPETDGMTVIRKAERHEGRFWHRLQPCRIPRHWEEATAAFFKAS